MTGGISSFNKPQSQFCGNKKYGRNRLLKQILKLHISL